MQIAFEVAGTAVEFRRSAFWGSAELRVGSDVVPLNSVTDVSTHLEFSLTKVWRQQVAGHEVVVEKVRPLLFAGLRPQLFRVMVDGRVVVERKGY